MTGLKPTRTPGKSPWRFLFRTVVFVGAISNLLLFLGSCDALLISFLVPIIWAAFWYPRWVYLAATGMAAGAATFTLYGLFENPATSLITLAATVASIIVAAELLHYLLARQRKLEAALRDSEAKFNYLATHIDQAYWLQKPDEPGLYYLSPGAAKVWGSLGERLRGSRDALLEAAAPADQERVRAHLAKAAIEKSEAEYRLPGPDGKMTWIRERSFPAFDAEGRPAIIAGIAEDITERTRLASQFHQAQKLECAGRMACSVAHDLNNILTVIQGRINLMEMSGDLDAAHADSISDIKFSVERAERLTRRILSSTRSHDPDPRQTDLNDVVATSLKMLRPLLDETVILRVEPEVVPLPIFADQGLLEQVLMNLVINARDAMPHGGQILISTSLAAPGEDGAARRFTSLTVSDTGHGIERENLERIFEPFFTTKPLGKGTGLGLPTVQSIVKLHGGELAVSSEVGRGTAFELRFPLAEPAPNPAPEPARAPLPKASGSVLLVEDDPRVREVTRLFLERLGYTVIEARSAVSALSASSQFKARIDVLVADMVLPDGMNGVQLACQLLEDNPEVRVVFTTGFPEESTHGEAIPSARLLRKPYNLRDLAEVVRACLAREGVQKAKLPAVS